MVSFRLLLVSVTGILVLCLALDTALAARREKKPDYVIELEREVELLRTTVEATYKEIEDLKKAATTKQAEMAKTLEQKTKELEELKAQVQAAQQGLERRTEELAAAHQADVDALKKPRESYPVRFDGQVRIRPLVRENVLDLTGAEDDLESYYGHRMRLGLMFEPVWWVQLYGQVENVSRFGSMNDAGEPYDLRFGVHQTYFRTNMPDLGYGIGWIQAGRQDYRLGSGRLVGSDDFAEMTQSFDGFAGHYNYEKYFDFDAFVFTIAERGTPIGADRVLFGGSMSFNFMELISSELGHAAVELDLVGLQDGNPDAEQKLVAVAVRLFGEVYGMYVDYESVWQIGQVEVLDPDAPPADGQVFTRALEHFAAAHYLKAGYNISKDWIGFMLGLGASFSWASGDANWMDESSAAFMPMYPEKHTYWGQMDLFGWSNVMEAGFWLRTEPIDDLFFVLEYHKFWMVEPAGKVSGFSESITNLVGAGYNSNDDLGHEIDVRFGYQFNKYFALETGYSAYLPGGGAEAARGLAGQGTDTAHWFYLQGRADL